MLAAKRRKNTQNDLGEQPNISPKRTGRNVILPTYRGAYNFKKYVEKVGGEILAGYQLRYMYFIDKSFRKRLTVPEIPFSKIDEIGAGMYLGEKVSVAERHVDK